MSTSDPTPKTPQQNEEKSKATTLETSKSGEATTQKLEKEAPKGVHKGVSDKLMNEIKEELENMLSFAMRNGKVINTELNPLIESNNLDDLINAHNILAKNVAPATPKSIKYLKTLNARDNSRTIFSKLPIIRNLIILALVFLALFIGTSLSDQVDNASLAKGVLDNDGTPLFLNLMFLCATSGLGVVFYLLKSVSEGIQKGTLMPEQSIYYVGLIVLGIMSGLILSEIVATYNGGKSLTVFNSCVLALVGGFSSDAIFTVLQGIINKIKAVFTSDDN
ncbi:hypothetical protein KORDIASMS9_02649 [Kordia sp. SMS9]|uniref:hypothetical protein n=1 Tax=Kordia sp. SMS9 TaxID=2282170 RepID=UPI000E10BC36|nr:hypothetical protein [Kordia sp. SMS9]AXG70409.1 hypothetical protein KORDIASMS9_02649 [Kordia sp. SMS9]